jgi:hypothetical protein
MNANLVAEFVAEPALNALTDNGHDFTSLSQHPSSVTDCSKFSPHNF